MTEQAPKIDLSAGGGRLVYDKSRRTIVSTPKEPQMTDHAMTFSNGLTPEHDDAIDDLMIDLKRISQRIEELGRHRSYSVAITKIEEANHWLRDRKHKPANG